jgi:hypothetical protein
LLPVLISLPTRTLTAPRFPSSWANCANCSAPGWFRPPSLETTARAGRSSRPGRPTDRQLPATATPNLCARASMDRGTQRVAGACHGCRSATAPIARWRTPAGRPSEERDHRCSRLSCAQGKQAPPACIRANRSPPASSSRCPFARESGASRRHRAAEERPRKPMRKRSARCSLPWACERPESARWGGA